jgi:hydroxymethylpyrimidine pyrophosphatase-like HAD family hydrolase
VGKPYRNEIRALAETYSWAVKADVTNLRRAVALSDGHPLIAIGSGGSYTAARLASRLHYYRCGVVSLAITPLETTELRIGHYAQTAWLFSARGRNVDIISAYQRVRESEPLEVFAFCMSRDSALAQQIAAGGGVYLGYEGPTTRDGFLATNSLLATSVLLLRSYGIELPPQLGDLLDHVAPDKLIDKYVDELDAIWRAEYILVLHGNTTDVGAIDLESKFSEAALGSINVSDFRNFAHGRHHWLTQHRERTAILTFVAPDDRTLADATLRRIPKDIPRYEVSLKCTGPRATLESLIQALLLTGAAGVARNIDPGRPGVAKFGSELYNLKSYGVKKRAGAATQRDTAIARKVCIPGGDEGSMRIRSEWEGHHRRFVDKLMAARFGAVVFDVDGTLIARDARYGEIEQPVIRAIKRLLDMQVVVGFATGRGEGVHEMLKRVIPRSHRMQVLIGSYNGATLRWLDDDTPSPASRPLEGLVEAQQVLRNITFPHDVTFRLRATQLSIRPAAVEIAPDAELLWKLAEEALVLSRVSGLKVVRSTHSIDVLPLDVSKSSVITEIATRARGSILAIGDMGAWPGNDFELLAGDFGLSVDAVSGRPNACWNLLPPGIRNVAGTLHYIERLNSRSNLAIFDPKAFS